MTTPPTTTQRPRNNNSQRIDQKIKPTEFFFLGKGTFFGTGDGGEWLQKRGSGRVKPNLFIALGQPAFQSEQTDYLSPFFTQTTSQFSQDTPSSTSFFAKFILGLHVTSRKIKLRNY